MLEPFFLNSPDTLYIQDENAFNAMLKLNINEGGMGSTRATTFGEFGGSFCSGDLFLEIYKNVL
jgi:hypothetical protein